MGKKAQARRDTGKPTIESGPPLRTSPNWPLLALSCAGILLSGYLSYTALTGGSVKGCSVGSACDLVLNSPWSKLFDLPTSVWGMLTYIALAATAFVRRVDRHWQLAWPIALFGLLYSVYLTTISLTVLKSACPYCLTSLGLMTAIFLLLTYQRPVSLSNFSWPGWFVKTAAPVLLIIVGLHLHYTGVLGEPATTEDPIATALAEHLTKSGVKFYGASWCPHCQQQKALFGAAARRLPYVECSPGGAPGTPQAPVCNDLKIESYPTWIINGQRHEEVLSMQQLAEASGFKAPAPAAPAPY
jgi:uncharacterized membrane protein